MESKTELAELSVKPERRVLIIVLIIVAIVVTVIGFLVLTLLPGLQGIARGSN